MKPILFNTEMVRAILDGRKTVTRRPVKPQPTNPRWNRIGWLGWDDGHGYKMRQPYKCGDILYVRETFVEWCGEYGYKASAEQPELWTGWKPSIHMPKEAARIFLRVTDVRMERLREITADEIFKEGIQADYIFSAFDTIWDSTIKPADRSAYGWEANPWVWVIEFERISKEATLCQAD